MQRQDTTTQATAAWIEHVKSEPPSQDTRTPGPLGEGLTVVELFEPPRGGVPAHVAVLTRGLMSRGWNVTVVGPGEASVMHQLAAAGARVVPMKIAHQPRPRDIVSVRALLETCRAGASLIHAHSTKAGLLAALTSRLSGVPSIYSPHSWSFDRALASPMRAGYAAYERRTARIHRLIIAVAESERQQGLRERIKDASAIRVVPNGLPTNAVEIDRDSARARLGIPRNRLVAAWVGRYARQKRPQDLPALARELGRAGISLVALGDGLAATPEAKGVAAAGGIVLADGSDPGLLYAAADVFVSTSAWEAHPITVLEAMRAGLPVVAYAVGGIPEQVDESRTGYLVPAGSLQALAARVVLLASAESLRRKMGVAARARQAEQFGIDTMVTRIEGLYRHVLSSANARTGPRSRRV